MNAVGLNLAQRWVQNFSRWDGDHNGQLEPSELFTQIGSTQPSAEDAAALACLYREVLHESHALKQMPCVDKARLKTYLLNLESRHMDLAFAHFQAKIRGEFEQPLRQGLAPSCALVSSAYALAQRDPAALPSMVSSTPEGLAVKFPGEAEAFHFGGLTDSERALHTSGLEAIEKAWGMHEGGQELGAIASARGNGADRVITALTGNPAKSVLLPNPPVFDYLNAAVQKKRPGSPPLTLPPLQPILQEIKTALEGQAIVVTGSWHEVTLPGLDPDHAYTVLACDPEQQRLSLRNPHGEGNNGIFELSVADYVANFNSVTIELRI